MSEPTARTPRSIVTRFVIVLALAGAIPIAVLGIWLSVREGADLDQATRTEIRLVGHTLDVSFGAALRDGQLVDVAETLRRLEQVGRDLDLYVLHPDGTPRAASEGALPVAEVAGPVAERLNAQVGDLLEDVPHPSGDRLVFATRLRGDSEDVLGILVVSRPLHDVDTDLQNTMWTLLVGLLGFLVASTGVGLVAGQVVIGAPLRALVQAIDAVGAGHADARLRPSGHDELAHVARRFDGMLDQLDRAQAELVASLEARRHLLEAVQRADKLASLGQLSATIAHEIGSPLHTMIGAAEWLAEAPGDPERTQAQATRIAEQGHRITQIVRQLLDLGLRRAPETVSPSRDAVGSVLDLLGVAARRQGIELLPSVQLPPDHLTDAPGAVQQVLLNLVQNALHWTPTGGQVRVTVRHGPWVDGLGRDRTGLRIAVSDTGPGVPEADRAHVFEPFWTTRPEQGGSGLGLTIVRTLCRDRGGDVWLTDDAAFEAVFPDPIAPPTPDPLT